MADTTNINSKGEASSPSLLQSVIGNVCISLGMCTYYLCGASDYQGKRGQTEEERQKEMDATFLGRIITCDMANCYDCDCGAFDDTDTQ